MDVLIIVRIRALGLLTMLFLPFAIIISSVPHTVWGQNREYPFADGGDSWGMGLLSLPCMLMCELSQMRMASMCYCCVITICGTAICGIFSCVHICSWNSNTQRYFSYYIMCFFLKKTLSPVLLLAVLLYRHRVLSNLFIHSFTLQIFI